MYCLVKSELFLVENGNYNSNLKNSLLYYISFSGIKIESENMEAWQMKSTKFRLQRKYNCAEHHKTFDVFFTLTHRKLEEKTEVY